jgi:hypothetical protein
MHKAMPDTTHGAPFVAVQQFSYTPPVSSEGDELFLFMN